MTYTLFARREFFRAGLGGIVVSALPLAVTRLSLGEAPASPTGRIYGLVRPPHPEENKPFRRYLVAIDSTGMVLGRTTVETGPEPRISPDGRWVAYESDGVLWTVELGDPVRKPRQIATLNDSSSYDPTVWAPDGRHLLCSPSRYDAGAKRWSFETFSVNFDGSELKKIPIPETDQVWDWSADGNTVLTLSRRDRGKGWQLYIMRPDASQATRLVDEAVTVPVRFSPDGRSVAFVHKDGGQAAISVVEASGKNRRMVYSVDREVNVGGLCWSPDGRYLAYTARRWERGKDGRLSSDQIASGAQVVGFVDVVSKQHRPIPLSNVIVVSDLDWR